LKCDQYPCKYCFTSCAIKRKRITFKPDELATTFISLTEQKRAQGRFLSSGIVPDADTTMEKMLATVERLRLQEGYTGYIHLKLIRGASYEYVEREVELADRVSLNLEAPKQAWAGRNLHEPVELNRASREQLLRIPGIGPKSADKIIAARREAKLRDLSQLRALGVTVGWATPYVLLDGQRSAVQLRLW
jgi:predicted DNA-binding helix-hairpin-helix protein